MKSEPMKKPALAITVFSLYLSVFAVASCASWQKGVKGALDVVEALCIVAHQDLPEKAVIDACGIAEAIIPEAKKLLAATKHETAKAAAAAQKSAVCLPAASDAGAPKDSGIDAR